MPKYLIMSALAIVLEISLIVILVGETTCDSKGGIIIACDLEELIVKKFLLSGK